MRRRLPLGMVGRGFFVTLLCAELPSMIGTLLLAMEHAGNGLLAFLPSSNPAKDPIHQGKKEREGIVDWLHEDGSGEGDYGERKPAGCENHVIHLFP